MIPTGQELYELINKIIDNQNYIYLGYGSITLVLLLFTRFILNYTLIYILISIIYIAVLVGLFILKSKVSDFFTDVTNKLQTMLTQNPDQIPPNQLKEINEIRDKSKALNSSITSLLTNLMLLTVFILFYSTYMLITISTRSAYNNQIGGKRRYRHLPKTSSTPR
jgi:hypothetical protein